MLGGAFCVENRLKGSMVDLQGATPSKETHSPSPSSYQLPRVRPRGHCPLPAEMLSNLHFGRAFACCHNCCELNVKLPRTQFPYSYSLAQAIPIDTDHSFVSAFFNDHCWVLGGGGDMIQISHLRLSFPSSFILCALAICGTLC